MELESLRQWRIEPQIFAQALSSSLRSPRALRTPIPDRAWSVGPFRSSGPSQSAVFVRGAAWPDGADTLNQIKRRLAANSLLVFVPSQIPTTASPGLQFVAISGRVGLDDGAVSIDFEQLSLGATPDASVVLTEAEETEFDKSGFKSRVPVKIAAMPQGGHGNVVLVGGEEVHIPDADFVLLLLLVLGLFERADGFVPVAELQAAQDESSRTATANAIFQYVGRLRGHFLDRVGTLSHLEFIETGRSSYRLSTHKRFVHWDQAALENHPKPAVQALARRLATVSE